MQKHRRMRVIHIMTGILALAIFAHAQVSVYVAGGATLTDLGGNTLAGETISGGVITNLASAALAPASTPAFSPPAGTYSSTQSVTITCSKGSPYYSTDGVTVTAYSTTISVSATETLQGGCYGTAYSPTLASAAYVISTLHSDNFAGSSLSGNWTVANGSFTIASNTFTGATGSAQNLAYWTADLSNVNQSSSVTLTAISINGIGIITRWQSGALSGYLGACTDSGGSTIYKVTAGSFVQIGSAGPNCGPTDVMELDATGTSTTTLVLKINGSTVITTSDSSTPFTSGAEGIWSFGNSGLSKAGTWVGGAI